MNETTKTDNHRRPAPVSIAIAATLVLLSAYVLSFGPTWWLYDRGCFPAAAGVIYTPINYVHRHCKPFADALDWYIKLWR